MTLSLPTMHGLIDRRMLVNFRVRPESVMPLLPSFFRPKLVKGWALAGICLIRLKDIRPRGLGPWFGVSSENAAHRLAVDRDGGVVDLLSVDRAFAQRKKAIDIGVRVGMGKVITQLARDGKAIGVAKERRPIGRRPGSQDRASQREVHASILLRRGRAEQARQSRRRGQRRERE